MNKPLLNRINNLQSLEINNIFNLFRRNKKIIGTFSILIIVSSFIYTFNLPKKYKGDFKILLDIKNQPRTIDLNTLKGAKIFLNKIGLGISKIPLTTEIKNEIKILKSPSVLTSSYSFATQRKGDEFLIDEKMDFIEWSKNINLNLSDQTNILLVEFYSYEKEEIIPILERIISDFKKYFELKSIRNKKINEKIDKKGIRDYYQNIIIYEELSDKIFEKKLTKSQNLSNLRIVNPPKIYNNHITPNRRNTIFTIILVGYLFLLFLILIKERIEGKIYEKNEVKNYLQYNLIGHLPYLDKSKDLNSFKIIREYLLKAGKSKVAIIPIGKVSIKQTTLLIEKLKLKTSKVSISFVEDLSLAFSFEGILIVSSLGDIEYKDIELNSNVLNIFKDSIIGLIIFDKNLN